MICSKTIHTIVLFGFLISSLLFGQHWPGLVLCIGDNGHIAVEQNSENGEHCHPQADNHSHNSHVEVDCSEIKEHVDECGDCLDFSLIESASIIYSRRPISPNPIVSSAHPLAMEVSLVFSAHASRHVECHHSWFQNTTQSIDLMQSTVLVI